MPRTRGKSTNNEKAPRKRCVLHCTDSHCSHASKKAVHKGEKKKKSDKKSAASLTTSSKVHKKKAIKSKSCHACAESISIKDLQECSACGHLFCEKTPCSDQLKAECSVCEKPICKWCFDFVVPNVTDDFEEDFVEEVGPHVIEMGEVHCHNCGKVTIEEHDASIRDQIEENVANNIVCPMCSGESEAASAYHCFERNLFRV
jgi:hypothetical protein